MRGNNSKIRPGKAGRRTRPMKLAMLVTYDDELRASQQLDSLPLKEQALIDRLFGKMKDAGFHAVLWRSMDGGRAMFRRSTEFRPTDLK